MTRLYIVVEGQTEETFVTKTLGPHLNAMGVWTESIIVTTKRDRKTGTKVAQGGGRWKHWRTDIEILTRHHPGSDVRFTTLFDLYGLPSDFPGLEAYGKEPNTLARAERLEAAMAQVIGDRRFIPYLQRHEFETLVLAGLDHLRKVFDDETDLQGLNKLATSLEDIDPEEVNGGTHTHPSKRLTNHIPSYNKFLDGPSVANDIGIPELKRRCPRFGQWVTRLETLAGFKAYLMEGPDLDGIDLTRDPSPMRKTPL